MVVGILRDEGRRMVEVTTTRDHGSQTGNAVSAESTLVIPQSVLVLQAPVGSSSLGVLQLCRSKRNTIREHSKDVFLAWAIRVGQKRPETQLLAYHPVSEDGGCDMSGLDSEDEDKDNFVYLHVKSLNKFQRKK